ncbi:MAG: class I SAM-dependent DNA methyltransferase [Saprospiraceae bacterium]|nr:class I SAM-dependent DNA methyltransferase [Saprospiraceae bacterium]
MNQLLWDTYRKNATAFVHEWAHERDEKGEAHSYWDAFLKIFNLERRRFARHEGRVKREGNRQGFIDLIWKGKMLVEQKSAHLDKPEDFDRTFRQAMEYVNGLPPEERPRRVVLCNFKRFRIYNLEDRKAGDFVEIAIAELPQRLTEFAFIPEFAGELIVAEEKANLDAVERIASIHKVLKSSHYTGHDLELLLVRMLFCMFAEDTGIFEPKQFSKYILNNTLENGSDIGEALVELFEILNTPVRRRDDVGAALKQFPYVNGGLFAEKLSKTPPGSMGLRNALETCAMFDWADISPEIFGSLFQAVLDDTERRALGAHYTSDTNIRRLIDPLFLDDLWAEFNAVRHDTKKLNAFRLKLGKLRFLDPACGCGNFLVVTYRELRVLDMEVVKVLQGIQYVTDTSLLANVQLGQFYGLEIKPVSALIAQVALHLTEHQANRVLLQTFGVTVPTIPLDESPNIVTGNALQTDWERLLYSPGVSKSPGEFAFIIGNPPFIGSKIMDDAQRDEIKTLFGNAPGSGTLDYVSGWYIRAAAYLDKHPDTKVAFVSTNSITQGEQVGMLWGTMLEKHGITIHFAHQTFKWTNEAPGVAAVYCIIVGFGKTKPARRLLFEYADIKGEPIVSEVKNINPYLVEAGDFFIQKRRKPILKVPEISFGSMPNDGGYLLFSDEEKKTFLTQEPEAAKWIKPMLSAHEFLNGKKRWCLWLVDISKNELAALNEVGKRVEEVKRYRSASTREATRKLAHTPALFGENRQPKTNFILIPRHSSENRKYIPMGFFSPDFIASDSCLSIANASIFDFGILTSEMHMAWVKYVCGRIKSDYRYSNEIVYNNFPFPTATTPDQKAAVEAAAQAVLDVRAHWLNPTPDPSPDTSGRGDAAPRNLAQLYDPDKMPADLLAAHQALDRAVDACYGVKKPFASEAKRVAYLFGLYVEMTKEKKNKALDATF